MNLHEKALMLQEIYRIVCSDQLTIASTENGLPEHVMLELNIRTKIFNELFKRFGTGLER